MKVDRLLIRQNVCRMCNDFLRSVMLTPTRFTICVLSEHTILPSSRNVLHGIRLMTTILRRLL